MRQDFAANLLITYLPTSIRVEFVIGCVCVKLYLCKLEASMVVLLLSSSFRKICCLGHPSEICHTLRYHYSTVCYHGITFTFPPKQPASLPYLLIIISTVFYCVYHVDDKALI